MVKSALRKCRPGVRGALAGVGPFGGRRPLPACLGADVLLYPNQLLGGPDRGPAGLAWTDAARTADFRVRAERLLSAARSFAAAGDAAQAATLAMLSARAFDRLDLSADEAIEAYTLARDSAERAGLSSVVVRAKAGLAEARRVLMSQR